ncbi:response regulator transcription factor [Micromonospora sp. DR5-3]|uniref:LuxR C-terminal-related transcriptional regulator n=1 Tax=unclassified Micromonospora TaxID=2617518 RepID=UPI0011D8B2F0|nr:MULTISPECIES: response regulator transcription factor [unclassified Micromonospora]MCW3815936.1 response regulator transcription factor [Micromonospora sp. DR5-3]TYC24433.1 response regulator transcription factor [Micromonospora sp. MP36]
MTDAATIEVSVVEDHPLYRTALVRALGDALDIRVSATARSVEEFAAYRQPAGAVVILDLKLPGVRDAAAVVAVTGMGHRVLVVSAHGDQSDVLGAIAAGARGYLTKDSDADEILRAVREIAAGNTYVSPTLASILLDSSRGRQPLYRVPLSDRERQVLSLLAAGERDQDIAEALAISVRTVRSHLDRIREKTGRRRRPELTRLAIEEGIATPAREH